MPYVGLELTIPASERAKTVHASDRSATVTGDHPTNFRKICIHKMSLFINERPSLALAQCLRYRQLVTKLHVFLYLVYRLLSLRLVNGASNFQFRHSLS
jgi:hypothetical protein